jgi:hypothetical protein
MESVAPSLPALLVCEKRHGFSATVESIVMNLTVDRVRVTYRSEDCFSETRRDENDVSVICGERDVGEGSLLDGLWLEDDFTK